MIFILFLLCNCVSQSERSTLRVNERRLEARLAPEYEQEQRYEEPRYEQRQRYEDPIYEQEYKPEVVTEREEIPQIDFYDSKIFDVNLSALLVKRYSMVKVTSLTPFNINHIPERIDKWLFAIKEYGGVVRTEIDPEAREPRGALSFILDLVILTYEMVMKMLLYAPAVNYDVTIFYQKGTGEVTNIVFSYKE